MADNYETMNQESPNYGCFKEAVCIDASRVYDSCGDKEKGAKPADFQLEVSLLPIFL